MLSFPNCKLNLGLNITAKRSDGYHDLETVFYPIGLNDALEIIESKALNFYASGMTIKGDEKENLCIKAYHLLKKNFPYLPPINIHLHKVIPMGAGLGGGSSDGAFLLNLLNNKFNLQLTQHQLIDFSLQLGSDCPFFILNKPCFAKGRGEVMTEISLDLSNYRILIVNPGIHISTGWAFAQLTPARSKLSIQEIIAQPIEIWKENLKNDFEEPVFKLHPDILSIKNKLYFSGATYASMSGSGSTVYGIFPSNMIPKVSFPGNYYWKWI